MIEILMGAVPVVAAWIWRFGYDKGCADSKMRRVGLGNGKALIIDDRALQGIRLGLEKLDISASKASDGMDAMSYAMQSRAHFHVDNANAIFKMTGVSA